MAKIEDLHFDLIINDENFKKQVESVKKMAQDLNTSVSNILDISQRIKVVSSEDVENTRKANKILIENAVLKDKIATATEKEVQARRKLNAKTTSDISRIEAVNQEKVAQATIKTQTAQERLNKLRNGETNHLSTSARLMQQLSNYAMTYLSVWGAKELVSNIVRITAEFEKQKVALSAILRDASGANVLFEQIKSLAVMSPFSFKELVTYTKQLSAYSIPMNELYETTKMLADVSAGLGVGMDRLVLAYGQIRSAAFLRGQEVRQLTEAGIPILKELQKQIQELEGKSITVSEVFDRISARQISFKMVEKVFKDMTSEGGKFYKMQEVLAETLAGKLSNLRDAYEIAFSEIGNSQSGLINGVVDGLRSMIDNYEKLGSVLKDLIIIFGVYKTAAAVTWVLEITQGAGSAMRALVLLRKALYETTIAQKLFNIAAKANPWAIIATTIAGAVLYLVEFGKVSANVSQILKKENDITENYNSTILKEQTHLKVLTDHLKKLKVGTEEYDNVKREIINRYGEYLSNVDREAISVGNLANVYDRLVESIINSQKAKFYQSAASEITSTMENQINSLMDTVIKVFNERGIDKNGEIGMQLREYALGLIEYASMTQEAKDAFDRLRDNEYKTGIFGSTTQVGIELEVIRNGIRDIRSRAEDSISRLSEKFKGNFNDSTNAVLDNWQKKVRETIGVTEKGFETNPSAYKEDESYLDYIDRLAKRYKELSEQIPKTEGEIEGLNIALKKEKATIEALNKAFGGKILADYGKEVTGKSAKQMQLESEIATLKELMKLYNDYREKGISDSEIRGVFRSQSSYSAYAEIEDYGKELEKKANELLVRFGNNAYKQAMSAMGAGDKEKTQQLLDAFVSEKEYAAKLEVLRNEYESFEAQRLAITKKYEVLIAKAKSDAEKEYYREQEKREVSSAQTKTFSTQIDVVRQMQSIGVVIKPVLDELISRLQSVMNSIEFKSFTEQDKQAFVEMLRTLQDSQNKDYANILNMSLPKMSYDKFVEALNRRNELQRQSESLKTSTDDKKRVEVANALMKADIELSNVTVDLAKNISDTQIAFGELFSGINSLFSGSLQGIGEGLMSFDKLFNSGDSGGKITEKVGYAIARLFQGKEGASITKQLADSMGKGGTLWSGIISAILSILDKLAEDAGKALGGIVDTVFNAANGIIEQALSGKLITSIGQSIYNGLYGLVDALSFGALGASNEREVARKTEELTKKIEILKYSIDELTDKLSESNGGRLFEIYGKTQDALERQRKYQLEVLKLQNSQYGKHHSNNYYWDRNNEEILSIFNQLSKYFGTAINDINDVYNLGAEKIKQIKVYLPDVWEEMLEVGKYDVSEYWDAVAELGDSMQELVDAFNEKLVGVSYNSLYDGFIETLMDMTSAASDFGDNLTKIMQEAMLRAQFEDKFGERLKALYSAIATELEKSQGYLTQGQIAALRAEYEQIAQEALVLRDQIANITGYTGDTGKEVASGITSITEDTANLLAAYINAIRADVAYGKLQREQIISSLGSILEKIPFCPRLDDYLNSIQANTYDTAQSNREILNTLRSVITSEGGFTAIRAYM